MQVILEGKQPAILQSGDTLAVKYAITVPFGCDTIVATWHCRLVGDTLTVAMSPSQESRPLPAIRPVILPVPAPTISDTDCTAMKDALLGYAYDDERNGNSANADALRVLAHEGDTLEDEDLAAWYRAADVHRKARV